MYLEQDIESSVQLFKAIADKTRLNILLVLLEKECSVNEIATQLNMSMSAISHQLKLLRLHDIVDVKRMGKYNYYRLKDTHIKIIIETTLEHIKESNY